VSETTINGQEQSVDDRKAQALLKKEGDLPGHIAFIMDGNGRWARRRGHERVVGHHQGVESVRDIVEACAQLGIGYVTLYTFSTENWERPDEEVDALMHLLVHTIREEKQTLMENDIRLRVMGDVRQVPDRCRRQLDEAIEATRANERMTLVMALSYSGHWEITRACRKIARQVAAGELAPEDIDEDVVAGHLCLPEVPDPDLLVRTSGEHRLSNFLLWQLAYTELHVTECLWPDFRRDDLYESIREYQQRERRYGRILPPEEST
jgi:undecaprenyl diphosphate synthase